MDLRRAIVGAVPIVGAIAAMGGVTQHTATTPDATGPARGIAVVELFTSEGCSSCPPADEFVGELAAAPASQREGVYLIVWHVDYWDHLGWKDPLGSPAASDRQRDYANAMKAKDLGGAGVYTPQLVVNGTHAMVGSDRARGTDAIASAKAGAPSAAVKLDLRAFKVSEPLHVSASIAGAPSRAECVGVLVEDDITVKVPKGENGGRTLKHTRVVRASAHKPVPAGGGAVEFELVPPGGVDMAKAHVVVFVQQSGYGAIVGAAEATPVVDGPVGGGAKPGDK